jgi:hypothetical protein
MLAGARANAEVFAGYPDVVICSVGQSKEASYIATVRDDGSAIYRPLAATNFDTVTPDHVFHHQGAKDCDGKSIEQLKKDGQTRTFQ